MKKLTMNRVAGAGLRANRRAYLSLAMGIFLSIFLIGAMALSVQGMALAMRQKVIQKMGSEDAILYDSDLTDEQLRDTGWFDEIGHVNITASIQEGAKYIGYYDETAANLLNRRLLEGRMPERPGEIAVETTVLDMLALDIHPGDAFELEVTPVEGAAATRQYTLTGILAEQSEDMRQSLGYIYYDTVVVLDMPALLVCEGEPAFDTGRLAVQRVMTLKPGKSGDKLINAWDDYDDSVIATISHYNGKLNTAYDYWGSDFVNAEVFCVLLLGAALLLVCGIGIAGSMESRLTQRVEQIGMLRAVGATGRQIRRMYGREAWLLALIVSPLALIAACVAVFAASRLLPDTLVFRPAPMLLIPVLGFSVVVVVLSASLPLKRASKILPMQILRDTKTLKKLRKVKSRRRFVPALLVAARQASLHPGRLIGPAALVALTMAILLFAVQLGSQIVSNSTSADFLLSNYGASSRAFCDLIPDSVLSSGDIAQIAALPEIGEVRAKRHAATILEIDRVADYFLEGEDDDERCTSPLSYPADYLLIDNGWQDGSDGMPEVRLKYARYNWALQQALGTDKKLIGLDLYTVGPGSAIWEQAAAEGKIDMDALDRGEQVLVYVPDHYRYVDSEGQVLYAPYPLSRSYKVYWQNDYFHAGQALPLHQLRRTEDDMSARTQTLETREDYLRLYDDALRLDANPTVGAVLTKYVSGFWTACLVTTEKGARAMGLAADHIETVDIYLNGSVDVEAEERLFQRVSGIAARGGMTAYNRLKSRRETYQEQRMGVITFISVAIVFLAAAVGLISGSIRRRVMADARAIGTLRAVGANAGAIRGCYSGQVLLTLLLGCAVGAILHGLYYWSDKFPMGAPLPLVLATQAAALMAVWSACALMLNRSVHTVTKKSIIENIREL